MTLARTLVAGISVLAAIGLSVEASRVARSESIVAESNAVLESATWRKAPPSLDTWLSVRNELLEAQRLAPGSPTVSESLGVLHGRRSSSREFLIYARDYFAHSLSMRPTSPYTWANYAQVKYLLGQTGPGFEQALVNAAHLGPWEPEVQRVVADIGLAVYAEVKPETRAVIAAIVGFAMRRNPLETLQISDKRGRLHVACAHVDNNRRVTDPRWTERCSKARPE
jgi:hypothetical protein